MLRKTTTRFALAASIAAGAFAGTVALPAAAQSVAPKAPKCVAVPERKAALNAEIAATQARLAALNAAKPSAAGHPRAIARIDHGLARNTQHLARVQGRLAALTARCP